MNEIVDPKGLAIADYTYLLPEERIARFPLSKRDEAKLLVYEKGDIQTRHFFELPEFLPSGSLLVLNDAKVVHARLLFRKDSGGLIEIFCLEPAPIYADMTLAMAEKGEVQWQCLVGGAAKWKEGQALVLQDGNGLSLSARMMQRNAEDFSIHFEWSDPELSFAEVLAHFGQVPLPPYMNRSASELDESSYQTVFAASEGSVAAPTASLHFTDEVLAALAANDVATTQLTLHVGAGTFKPVKSATAGAHSMHSEWIELSEATLQRLWQQGDQPVIAAGTTALRTLESLYWFGWKISRQPLADRGDFQLDQWECYALKPDADFSRKAAIEAILGWMQQSKTTRFLAKTGIMIAPGYHFKMTDALITNFHQPQSTLLLLVAAFVGQDWKRIYDYALDNSFRFLSYGDANLLWHSS
ncbi:MAG: S-adenosylmethionine:tRNA ribosyltransferase-isomerase [Bacteroidetes bacterium]|nr:S-adenosylmethionine:tRNA ribosyltransferase-isomerase [Bacteroidota bacterium]